MVEASIVTATVPSPLGLTIEIGLRALANDGTNVSRSFWSTGAARADRVGLRANWIAFMRIFHCDHCSQLVFFEISECVNCHHPLAFLPDAGYIGSLDKREDGTWHSPVPALEGKAYRLCRNYTEHAVCN